MSWTLISEENHPRWCRQGVLLHREKKDKKWVMGYFPLCVGSGGMGGGGGSHFNDIKKVFSLNSSYPMPLSFHNLHSVSQPTSLFDGKIVPVPYIHLFRFFMLTYFLFFFFEYSVVLLCNSFFRNVCFWSDRNVSGGNLRHQVHSGLCVPHPGQLPGVHLQKRVSTYTADVGTGQANSSRNGRGTVSYRMQSILVFLIKFRQFSESWSLPRCLWIKSKTFQW